MICEHCNGKGSEPSQEHEGLSCLECNGMGEIYEENDK
jgi:DnaJ-class molecular chaperone